MSAQHINNAPIDAAAPSDIERLEKGHGQAHTTHTHNGQSDLNRRNSPSDVATYDEKNAQEVAHDEAEVAEHKEHKTELYQRFRPFILAATALVILGWWISSIVLKQTRHRWVVQSLFSAFFLLVIIFRFVPASIISRPIEAVWQPLISRPFFKLPYMARLGLGWFALLATVLGSAYGFPLLNVSFHDNCANFEQF
jgi:CNT family concentrative nucleoside transporter